MSDNSLIRDIGRSFIVSSFVPAALFITIATLLFRDFSPLTLANRLIPNDQLYAGQWFLFALFVFWTGFGLYSAWNWTVKLFEGYYLPSWLAKGFRDLLYFEKLKRMEQIERFYHLREQRLRLTEDQLAQLSPMEQEIFAQQQFRAMEDYQVIELLYPKERQHFLPTRLGNLLRASEMYSWDRYGMEGVTCFSRLVHLFPPSFANQLEEQNNKFIFLLNSALLSILIGLLNITIVLIRQPCYFLHPRIMDGALSFYADFACTDNVPKNFFQKGFTSISENEYFLIGLGALVVGYVLYRVSIIAANAYTRLIRAGFDLYRFELLNKLKLPLELTLSDERSQWQTISQFLISAQDLGDLEFEYDLPPKSDAKEQPQSKGCLLYRMIDRLTLKRSD